VLGFARHQGALYVHLGDAPEAVVVLANAPAPRAHLESASHRVSDFRWDDGAVVVRQAGVGAKSAVVAGLAPGARRQARLTDSRGARTVALVADASGGVSIDAGDAAQVEIRAG
jgi:hypothetical protein